MYLHENHEQKSQSFCVNNSSFLQCSDFLKAKNKPYLAVFAILDVLLPVEEPIRDLVLAGVAHDCYNLLNLK